MSRRIMLLAAAVAAFAGLLQAQPVADRAGFLKGMQEKQASMKNISGSFEMGISMMGSAMKIPGKFWQKDEKIRMDMDIRMPGMETSMEQIMIMDGKKMLQYQKMMNTVITVDMTKMPEEIRKAMKQSSLVGGKDTFSGMEKIADEVEIEETSRNGKKCFLLTLNDISKLSGMTPLGMANPGQMFKKLLIWIDRETLLPALVQIFGESETPGMWIEFKDIKTSDIGEDIFKAAFPADAKQIDMTDAVMKMFEHKK